MSLSGNLKKYRKLSNLRQDQVARALGIDRSTYSYYETGKTKPAIPVLVEICAMYGIELNTLIDNDTPSEVDSPVLQQIESRQESVQSMNRLTKGEQDMVLLYRRLNDSGKSEIVSKAKAILQKEIDSAE